MKKIGYALLILLLAITAVVVFRWDTIQQCSQKYDNDTPPMHFIASFIDSFTPADCSTPEPVEADFSPVGTGDFTFINTLPERTRKSEVVEEISTGVVIDGKNENSLIRRNTIEDYDNYTISQAYEKRIREIPSPAFTLIDTFPEGTEKIRISRRNGNQSDTYFLKQFDTQKKTFTANFRLNLGNIASGENEYLIWFYLPNGQVKEGKFSLPCYFSEIKLGNDILYLNEGLLENHTIINAEGVRDRKKNNLILIKYNGTYYTESTPFLVDTEKGLLYQITNPTMQNGHLYGDLQKYKEPLLAKNIEMFFPEVYATTTVNYNQESQKIEIKNIQGDSCEGTLEYGIYDVITQKYVKKIYEYKADCDNFELTIQNAILGQELRIFTTMTIDEHDIDDWKDDTVTDDGVKYQYATLSNGKYIQQKEGYVVEHHNVAPYYDPQTEDIYRRVEVISNVDYDTMLLTITINNKKFQRNIDDLSVFKEL